MKSVPIASNFLLEFIWFENENENETLSRWFVAKLNWDEIPISLKCHKHFLNVSLRINSLHLGELKLWWSSRRYNVCI